MHSWNVKATVKPSNWISKVCWLHTSWNWWLFVCFFLSSFQKHVCVCTSISLFVAFAESVCIWLCQNKYLSRSVWQSLSFFSIKVNDIHLFGCSALNISNTHACMSDNARCSNALALSVYVFLSSLFYRLH